MEYNKIVVPLDGSNLAESVMPHVIKIAKGGNAAGDSGDGDRTGSR